MAVSYSKGIKISIHALLAESDLAPKQNPTEQRDFYPRSPCGERPSYSVHEVFANFISIHALLAESDLQERFLVQSALLFLSTLSLRRATYATEWSEGAEFAFLSTLSLRRATIDDFEPSNTRRYFYPRSPCGERHISSRPMYHITYFYPRSPCGERLCMGVTVLGIQHISIHALLAESDSKSAQNSGALLRI